MYLGLFSFLLKFEHAVVIVLKKKKRFFFLSICVPMLKVACSGCYQIVSELDCVFTLPELIDRCATVVPFSNREMTVIRTFGKPGAA